MEIDKKRQKLPFVETAICIAIYGRKIVAKKLKSGFEFPSAVITTEDKQEALQQEFLKQVGVEITKPRHLTTFKFDWSVDDEDLPLIKDLYAKFRGEEQHIYIAFCYKPKGDEPSKWKGGVAENVYYADELTDLLEKQSGEKSVNHELLSVQIGILKMVKIMMDMSKKQKTIAKKNVAGNQKIEDVFAHKLY